MLRLKEFIKTLMIMALVWAMPILFVSWIKYRVLVMIGVGLTYGVMCYTNVELIKGRGEG